MHDPANPPKIDLKSNASEKIMPNIMFEAADGSAPKKVVVTAALVEEGLK